MNYEFGIRNGEPFFEPSYKMFLPQTFYYEYLKNDGSDNYTPANGYLRSRFFEISHDTVIKDGFFIPEKMSFINGKYYFLKGEIIFISNKDVVNNIDFGDDTDPNAGVNLLPATGAVGHPDNNDTFYANTRWNWAYRHIENSVSDVRFLESLPSTDTYTESSIKRVKEVEDMLLFEVKSIFNDKNIVDIQEYGRTYDFQEFTDLHIHYGGNKVYKLKIQGNVTYKKVLRKDIPFIDNKDWIRYLSKSIVRNINTKKYKITFTSKLIPSLKYGDYIAIQNSYLKVVYK